MLPIILQSFVNIAIFQHRNNIQTFQYFIIIMQIMFIAIVNIRNGVGLMQSWDGAGPEIGRVRDGIWTELGRPRGETGRTLRRSCGFRNGIEPVLRRNGDIGWNMNEGKAIFRKKGLLWLDGVFFFLSKTGGLKRGVGGFSW